MNSFKTPGKIKILAIAILGFSSVFASAQKIWTLEDCINYALENNLDIKKQLETVESNKATKLQTGLSMLPSINAQATNAWNFGQTIDQYTNTFASSKVLNENFAVQADLTIFGGLQKFNALKQSKIDLMASQYDLDVLKNDISLSVAGFYLDMLFSYELLAIAKEQYNITKQQVERISKMVDAGSAAKGDLLNIQAQASTEELNVVEAENKLAISSLSLQQLIDLPVSRDFVIERPSLKLIQPPIDTITPEIIYDKALGIRPEIKGAELRVESSMKSLSIARGGVSPVLSFSGNWATGYSGASQEINPDIAPVYGLYPTGITQSTHDTVLTFTQEYTYKTKSFGDQIVDNNNKTLGFYLRIPIFNGWQVRNSISQAKIQMNIAELTLETKKRDLRKLIEQGYVDAVSALKKYNTSLEKVNAQQESFNYTSQKFDVGMMTSFDYNNSKKDLTKAQSDLLQAKYDFIFKTTILDFYMGNPIRIVRE